MKPSLHRSITFWSGIVVMAFLCWAWWDSKYYSSYITTSRFKLESGACGFSVATLPPEGGKLDFHRSSKAELAPISRPDPWLPLPYFARGGGEDSQAFEALVMDEVDRKHDSRGWAIWFSRFEQVDYRLIFIPYWFILLAVAIPWLGLLIWRARRRKNSPALSPPSA